MANAINRDLVLYEAQFNSDEFTAENHLARAFLTKGSVLSPVVTHLYGGGGKQFSAYNFPMLWLTEGNGNIAKTTIDSTDLSFKVDVMGRPKKSEAIAKSLYSDTEKVGIGRKRFLVPFKSNWFKVNQVLYLPNKMNVRVVSPYEHKDNMYYYTCELVTNNSNAYVPAKYLKAGVRWGGGIVKVSKIKSRGTESRSYTPFKVQNQISVARDTYNIVGNMKNKVMVIEIKVDGKSFKYWVQWELYLKHLIFKEVCEHDLWWSTYNKDADGIIQNIDENSGEVITSGAGINQQIPNSDTYARLTTNKLDNIISEIFYNTSGAEKAQIDVFTGTGGMREISRAMEEKMQGWTLVQSDVMSTNKSGKRTYKGVYFDTYEHVDGHTMTFRRHPMFDRGIIGEISDPHPTQGLNTHSFDMYFIDTSVYEGQSNVQYISEAGREEIQKYVQGMAQLPEAGDSMYASSDIDASSIQIMKTQGIHIMRPTNCFKLEYAAAG